MTINIPTSTYTIAWALWILWFAVWETLAIIDQGENETFSGHLKTVMWHDSGRPTIVAFLALPALVWLVWHLYSEVRTHWTP
jgi:hypothetical protein